MGDRAESIASVKGFTPVQRPKDNHPEAVPAGAFRLFQASVGKRANMMLAEGSVGPSMLLGFDDRVLSKS